MIFDGRDVFKLVSERYLNRLKCPVDDIRFEGLAFVPCYRLAKAVVDFEFEPWSSPSMFLCQGQYFYTLGKLVLPLLIGK